MASEHPALTAARVAPVDELPETDEERRLVQEALTDPSPPYTQAEVEATIEHWKRRELAK